MVSATCKFHDTRRQGWKSMEKLEMFQDDLETTSLYLEEVAHL